MIFDNSAVADVKNDDVVNSTWTWSLKHYILSIFEVYAEPFSEIVISLVYSIYLRMTLMNVVIFAIKYIPPGYYMYKFVKEILLKSRERLKQKQLELEDIQLKVKIVNTELSVRDSSFSERAEVLRREKERLRRIRLRVRTMVANDAGLQRALEAAANCDAELDLQAPLHSSQQDDELITELLNGYTVDRVVIPDRGCDIVGCECASASEQSNSSPANSIYSSLSDMDVSQDCRVKIVKVTNVYKVAYLKHYNKHKRLRRANKRGLLHKKMENIKKVMEDWQKTLNMVINTSAMDLHPLDVASQEAMGDYSKPRDSSTEGDLRPYNDAFYNEFNVGWMQNAYRPYWNEDRYQESRAYDSEYDSLSNGDVKCEYGARKRSLIEEETSSQVAIAELEENDPILV